MGILLIGFATLTGTLCITWALTGNLIMSNLDRIGWFD